ncbi:MAG: GNAT family N-acetyltransferase [Polyangiaceae bacterium]|nr:GNAT family N-acetyltransferase [Polyangiaceae bacterium]
MALEFRAAKKSDLERLVEIHAAAFPDARGVEERTRVLTANPFGPLQDLVVVERDGELVGHAFLFRIKAWFGGRKVRVGAIASVGVAVEARGQGIGSRVLDELHRRSSVRGDAITMLYPFRQGYYARLGYGGGAPHKRLSCDPASIPAAWRLAAREHVVRADGRDREGMRRAYATAALHASGWIDRREAFWERRLTRDHVTHLAVRGKARGSIRGYVAFAITQAEASAEASVLVEELVAVDDAARRALFGALGALRDQASVVELEVSADDPLEFALMDPKNVLGAVAGGPMVRMNDTTRAIEARGYARDGTLDIVVDDGEASVLFVVCIESGRARVHAMAPKDRASAFSTSKATLASILYGGLRPSGALRLGLAEAAPSVAVRADELLAIPLLAPLDPF